MKIGIHDISIYVPELYVSIDDIVDNRKMQNQKIASIIEKSADFVMQKEFRINYFYQDSIVLGLEAITKLLDNNDYDLKTLICLISATETSIDLSKPISAYVQGVLEKSYSLTNNISSFQVQHACAAGSIALINACNMLHFNDGLALTLNTDIAQYDKASAEATQGSGSSALLLKRDPDLISIDLNNVVNVSGDKDDFFKPLFHKYPSVKGRYSILCYQNSLKQTFKEYCKKIDSDPKKVLYEIDYFVFHMPYVKMGKEAFTTLIKDNIDLDKEELEKFLTKKGFYDSINLTELWGNLYTSSVFVAFISLLYNKYKKGEDLVDKKVLFFSYGSGNTMVCYCGNIEKNYKKVLNKWDIASILEDKKRASFEQYLAWYEYNYDYKEEDIINKIKDKDYYLANIKDDGYRIYKKNE